MQSVLVRSPRRRHELRGQGRTALLLRASPVLPAYTVYAGSTGDVRKYGVRVDVVGAKYQRSDNDGRGFEDH